MPPPFDHSPTDGPDDPCPACAAVMSKVDLLKAIVSLQKTIAGMTAQAIEHFDEEIRLTSDVLTYKRQLSEALHELSLLKR